MKKIDLDEDKDFKIVQTSKKVFLDDDNPLDIKEASHGKTFIESNKDVEYKEVPKKTTLKKINEVEVPQIEYKSKSEDIYEEVFGEECVTRFGTESTEGYFVLENLFSELVSDYQRSMARYNLGIGEEYSLEWGNISGSIENQEDLRNYMEENINFYVDKYGKEVNRLLAIWTARINFILSQKIDKYSPHLEGEPKTTLPDISDDSGRIASTEWVNIKLSMDESNILKWIKLSSDHMFYGEPPKTVMLQWDFYQEVDEVKVNGTTINSGIKSLTIPNLNNDYVIHFYYRVGGLEYNKFLTFQKVHAIYYSEEFLTNPTLGIKDFPLYVDLGEDKFVHLYIPGDKDAGLSVNNIYGGFKAVSSVLINDILYYVYRTVNSGLGKLKIEYDKE